MAISLALIIILGLLSDYLFRWIRLPGIIGMLFAGILAGPYVLDLIDPAVIKVSSDFRMIALIVILLRAGFATKRETLNRVGKRALLVGFVPAVFEGAFVALIAPFFFHVSPIEAAILGSVVAAVSPAVVVPSMIKFIEDDRGTKKGIPTLLLASSSLDNVFVIVIFSALIGMYEGESTNILMKLLDVPVSMTLGITAGIVTGFALYMIFEIYEPRATKKGMIVIGTAILLTWLEKAVKPFVSISALSGVIAIGFIILEKSEPMAHKISRKLGKIWVFAEILLFVLVGTQVNIHVALDAGLAGAAVIFLGLMARSAGTYISLIRTGLNFREKLFCMVAYIPKATVQAAIGAVPLSIGVRSGEIILAVAVLSILFTAPIGAIAMNVTGEKFLEKG
ncbi:MAG: cation:proton antiporter [Nitrospirae bacterium]|nr:cation:proton antiporter [Nitrospirota bacterium]MBI4847269.1 cation:proton antiporter [Nitrospirota bacterium]